MLFPQVSLLFVRSGPSSMWLVFFRRLVVHGDLFTLAPEKPCFSWGLLILGFFSAPLSVNPVPSAACLLGIPPHFWSFSNAHPSLPPFLPLSLPSFQFSVLVYIDLLFFLPFPCSPSFSPASSSLYPSSSSSSSSKPVCSVITGTLARKRKR